jgi:hypothetical protein
LFLVAGDLRRKPYRFPSACHTRSHDFRIGTSDRAGKLHDPLCLPKTLKAAKSLGF